MMPRSTKWIQRKYQAARSGLCNANRELAQSCDDRSVGRINTAIWMMDQMIAKVNRLDAAEETVRVLCGAISERDENIAELESKLAKALDALQAAAESLDDYSPLTGNTIETTASKAIRTTIAELKGSNDE